MLDSCQIIIIISLETKPFTQTLCKGSSSQTIPKKPTWGMKALTIIKLLNFWTLLYFIYMYCTQHKTVLLYIEHFFIWYFILFNINQYCLLACHFCIKRCFLKYFQIFITVFFTFIPQQCVWCLPQISLQ